MARRMLLVVIVGLMSMPADAASDIDFGPYHALIIGIDDYQYLPPLTTAVNDALAVAEVLRERYDFTATVLLDPDRSEILRALERLRLVLTEGDNLLIYYAGRAIVDIEAETSYWQPADAERGAGANRISADSLSDVVDAIPAKHVIVVSDAAYSGPITRTPRLAIEGRLRREAELARLSARSRTALISGSVMPLDDGAGGGHSVFARGFLTVMREGKKLFDGRDLFAAIRRLVLGDPSSPLKKASLTGFHATAKHIAAKAVSPSSETMRTI